MEKRKSEKRFLIIRNRITGRNTETEEHGDYRSGLQDELFSSCVFNFNLPEFSFRGGDRDVDRGRMGDG